MYTEVTFLSNINYSYILNEFSDIITTQVLAVGIPHAKATTEQRCHEIDSNTSVLCCWDATTTPFGVVAPSQREGRRAVLASPCEGRVTPGYTKVGGKATLFPYD